MLPLASQKVGLTLQAWLMEGNRTRYEKIGSQIDETLGDNEVGLLFIGERHQVQFAQDIEVLYVRRRPKRTSRLGCTSGCSSSRPLRQGSLKTKSDRRVIVF